MSNMILIKSLNANTPVDLINGFPDLSTFTEPTLSILQSAFDNGNYEIIPDPEPIPEIPTPQWGQFNAYFFTNQDFLNYYLIGKQNCLIITDNLGVGLRSAMDGDIPAFQLVFVLFCQYTGVTSQHRNQWASVAESCNLPVEFVEVVRG